MKKYQKTSKFNWILKHKLLVFVLLVLVVLPLIMIPSIYIIQYNSNKPILFEDKNAEVTSLKNTPFELNYQVIEMRETSDDLTGGYYRVRYTLTKKTTVNSISNVKLTYQMSTNWDRYTANSTEQINPIGSQRIAQINFNYDLNQSVLPFVKVGIPVLYVKIAYTETILNNEFEKVVYIKLPYNYVDHETVIIPA
ncbi:MAG: hypothetical protein RBQ91_06465 [Acholeplasma sp.]|nr:hypothetical protein [Acholeplasma sp.]